jgi:restriction system protein
VMSIWEYTDRVRDQQVVKAGVELLDCPFCSSKLDTLKEGIDRSVSAPGNEYEHRTFRVRACPMCGWWNAYDRVDSKVGHVLSTVVLGAAARLRSLDLLDLSLPIEEVRSYLAAQYEARFDIHPRLFEETVASVFRDHGYLAETTAYSMMAE